MTDGLGWQCKPEGTGRGCSGRRGREAFASGCTIVYVVNKFIPVVCYVFTVVTFKGVCDSLCCLTALYRLQY